MPADDRPVDSKPDDKSRVVAIIKKHRVVELWHIVCRDTDYKEREINLPKKVRKRVVNGQPQHCDVHTHQIARQEWGRFSVRRYEATRIKPWASSLGILMLIPGTLLAAGSAHQDITGVPLGLLILAVGLITVGGSLVIASGWRILVRTSFPSSCVPLESIGVSRTALGFTREVVASESMPPGYLFGRYKGEIEIVAPLGDWTVVEQYSTSAGWYRKHPAPEPSPLPH